MTQGMETVARFYGTLLFIRYHFSLRNAKISIPQQCGCVSQFFLEYLAIVRRHTDTLKYIFLVSYTVEIIVL